MKSYHPNRGSKQMSSKPKNRRAGTASTCLLLTCAIVPPVLGAASFGHVIAVVGLLSYLGIGWAMGTRFRKTWIREFPSKRGEISDALSSGRIRGGNLRHLAIESSLRCTVRSFLDPPGPAIHKSITGLAPLVDRERRSAMLGRGSRRVGRRGRFAGRAILMRIQTERGTTHFVPS